MCQMPNVTAKVLTWILQVECVTKACRCSLKYLNVLLYAEACFVKTKPIRPKSEKRISAPWCFITGLFDAQVLTQSLYKYHKISCLCIPYVGTLKSYNRFSFKCVSLLLEDEPHQANVRENDLWVVLIKSIMWLSWKIWILIKNIILLYVI